MDDVAQGQDYCNYLISRLKNPPGDIVLTVLNKDAAHLTQILNRELSDRITVTCAKLGITAKDYYINKMEHEILNGGKIHQATYSLSEIGDEGEFWCLGVSKLGDLGGQTTRLGY